MPILHCQRFSLADDRCHDMLSTYADQLPVFLTREWLYAMSQSFRYEVDVFVVSSGTDPVSITVVPKKQRGGIVIAPPFPLTPSNLVVCPGNSSLKSQKAEHVLQRAMEILIDELERAFDVVSLALPSDFLDTRVFSWRSWRAIPRYTYRIELDSMQSVRARYSQSLRRKLNSAAKRFQIRKINRPDIIAEMFEGSYHRKNIAPPFPGSVLRNLLETLHRSQAIESWSIENDSGKIQAVRVVVNDSGTWYDWIAGALPDSSPASHVLVDFLLEYALEHGAEAFDFMGANTPKVIDFKRAFGGRLLLSFNVEWERNALLRFLRHRHNVLLRRKRNL